jgi:hypothetical protein
MRLIQADFPRADIDAEIRAAVCPGHVPARWALPLLDELERMADGWQLVRLDEGDLSRLWLPAHAGERCHGDTMRLGDGADGSDLRGAGRWLADNRDAYAAANPSCWGRIDLASRSGPSRLVVSPVTVGDRIKPDDAALVVVDGLHRALGLWSAGRRTCEAYFPVLRQGSDP